MFNTTFKIFSLLASKMVTDKMHIQHYISHEFQQKRTATGTNPFDISLER